MDAAKREEIMQKNQKLIDMVVERAKRDFPDDIAIIGLTGSFNTGDFHEKSDLDLIIINNTDRGWGIASGFILGEVGYDIYCTPWDTRIQAQSKLESPMVSCLVELQILYSAKPEYLEKFNRYKQNALDLLAQPIGKPCLERASKDIAQAKQAYADAMLSKDLGSVRYAAGCTLYHLINALVGMNNTYINRGIKRYLEMLRDYAYLPDDFESLYFAVIDAKTVEPLQIASLRLLRAVVGLYEEMRSKFIEKPTPSYENLWGVYEEFFCNSRNKIMASVEANDTSYAFLAALGAQNYIDEMTGDRGTPRIELMGAFDPDDLSQLEHAFMRAMDVYLAEYEKVGRTVERYDTLEALYEHYMKP